MNVAEIAAEYGHLVYPITFVWTFLEGETFVIFAGLAAELGYLNPWGILVAAWLGSFAGDQLYYWIGRRWGERVLIRMPRWRPGVETALAWLRRYDTWFILSFRYIYGVRQFSSFAVGMAGVGPLRFVVLNFIAAGIWASSYVGFGYFFGQALEAMLGDIALVFGLIVLGMFALAIGLVSYGNRRLRQSTRSS